MKNLILVASPPACGKNYVSEIICKALNGVAYFDKDDLALLIRRSFALCRQEIDMDGTFYLDNLRDAEYQTLLQLAFSALQFENLVLVNAPFLKEVRDERYFKSLKEKANSFGANLVLIWVSAPLNVCYERMKKRASDRDGQKIANWDDYVKKTNYTPPFSLKENDCVDEFIIFNNENDDTAHESLNKTLKLLME